MATNAKSTRTLIGLALAFAAAATPLPAANGDVPIYQATTITQPGRYVVTRDIAAAGNVIVVQSGGVTLDLNGHTLTSQVGTGVLFDMSGIPVPPCNIVANGRIVGGDRGIRGINLPAVMPILIEKVGIVGPMFHCMEFFGGQVEVRGSVVRECGGHGILMNGNVTGTVEVEDTLITDVQGSGLFADGANEVTLRASTIRRFGLDVANDAGGVRVIAPWKVGVMVVDSVLADGSVRAAGLLLQMAGHHGPIDIVGNGISGNGASGIDLRQGAARITGNTISGNLADGIRTDAAGIVSPSMISGNSIFGNALNGADLRDGAARFNGNTVGGNLGDGVKVAGARSLVENNFLEENGGYGIHFVTGTGHAYRGNFVRGNLLGDVLQDQPGSTDAGGNIK